MVEIGHPRQNGKLLRTFQLEAKQQQERYREYSFEEFIGMLERGEVKHPYSNAAKLLLEAIEDKGVTQTPRGTREFQFFTGRQDKYAVFGADQNIDLLVRAIHSCANQVGGGRMIVLVSPTGAGKTSVVEALKRGLEEYTRAAPPIYTIAGCPIFENPLHLLDQAAREELREVLGVSVTGELCPHCQEQLETEFDYDPIKIKIRALDFSIKLARGIVKIEEALTNSHDPAAPNLIRELILKSNRGILEIPEIRRQGGAFLQAINDLLRERVAHDQRGRKYQLDNVILGHTTREEWLEFKKGKGLASLFERMEEVDIRYKTSRATEARIYQKAFAESNWQGHESPRTREVLAEVAVRTRVFDSKTVPTAKIPQKVELYDGVNILNLSRDDQRKIEDEAAASEEGLVGISPPLAIERLAQTVARRSECITPIMVLGELERFFREAQTSLDKNSVLGHIKEVRGKYDKWLAETVIAAFRGKYEDDLNILLQEYLKHAARYITKTPDRNPTTGEEEGHNEAFMLELENLGHGRSLTQNERDEFRSRVLRLPGSLARHQQEFTFEAVKKEIPELTRGIEKKITGADDEIEQIFKLLASGQPPNPKQEQRLHEAEAALINKNGFCETCAPELMRHAAHLVCQTKTS